jgi:hypothetical protein
MSTDGAVDIFRTTETDLYLCADEIGNIWMNGYESGCLKIVITVLNETVPGDLL